LFPIIIATGRTDEPTAISPSPVRGFAAFGAFVAVVTVGFWVVIFFSAVDEADEVVVEGDNREQEERDITNAILIKAIAVLIKPFDCRFIFIIISCSFPGS